MELRHLRYFVAAAEEENFNKAAARLNIAQPALSRQIRDLELDLGVELFERQSHRVRLSAVGRVFLMQARKVLAAAQDAREEARRASRGQSGLIRVGFNRISSRHRILPTSLRAFSTDFPEVEIKLTPLLAEKQIAALRGEELDAGFFCFRPEEDPAFAWLPVAEEEMMVALPRDHPLADAPDLRLGDLAEEPFVYFPRSYNPLMYDTVYDACRAGGLVPCVQQEAITEEAMLSLVSVGMGITFVGASMQCVYDRQIAFRRVRGFDCRLTLELVWLQSNGSPSLARFVETVRSQIEAGEREARVAGTVRKGCG